MQSMKISKDVSRLSSTKRHECDMIYINDLLCIMASRLVEDQTL